jgi:hypothetical protein
MTSLSELEKHSTTPPDEHHHGSVSSNLNRNLSLMPTRSLTIGPKNLSIDFVELGTL